MWLPNGVAEELKTVAYATPPMEERRRKTKEEKKEHLCGHWCECRQADRLSHAEELKTVAYATPPMEVRRRKTKEEKKEHLCGHWCECRQADRLSHATITFVMPGCRCFFNRGEKIWCVITVSLFVCFS